MSVKDKWEQLVIKLGKGSDRDMRAYRRFRELSRLMGNNNRKAFVNIVERTMRVKKDGRMGEAVPSEKDNGQ